MENVIGENSNIKVEAQRINKIKVKKRDRKNKFSSVKNKYLQKFIYQIFFCLTMILTIYIYKVVNADGFLSISNKYQWLMNYDMSYIDIYNSSANFLNNNFQFNIPIKEKVEKKEAVNVAQENSNDNMRSIVDETQNESTIQVSTAYDSMRVLADEIKAKYVFVLPTTGKITCEFGNRDPSRPDISQFHLGLDIANNIGTEITSCIDGKVSEVSYNSTYGNYVKISREDVVTIYAHCSKILVKKNEDVKGGQKIALMGESGMATGPHLHFEVRKNNQVINPEYLLNFR